MSCSHLEEPFQNYRNLYIVKNVLSVSTLKIQMEELMYVFLVSTEVVLPPNSTTRPFTSENLDIRSR